MMKKDAEFSLEELIDPISVDLQLVEESLLAETETLVGSIKSMNSYVHNSGGKRLRPALLLYVSHILGGNMETARQLAVIVEYIHAATLVHDDVIDDSDMRRGRESLNALRRNKEAILFGDWLYMTSFWKALSMENFRFLETLIKATRLMVEGELLQMEMVSNPGITLDIRRKITFCKTAGFFGCCCSLGVLCASAREKNVKGFAAYGEALGMAFQLVDDLLDYSSGTETLGKPVLQDLDEGNITLPTIYLLEKAGEEEAEFIRDVIRRGGPGPEEKERILELLREYDCLEQSAHQARLYADQACAALESVTLPAEAKALLARLPEWILNRPF